ncbi:CARDB domain-containing protein [Paenibacillus hamazuiensis]|uniref:CARDB domain-containing protein n=1 Tax=Paenibacillus hamazuiensis TaxID=2936508 RepID=UPI00200DFF61|nr:CARDB domain-containing protein [Paenibacillus hamazuiensis]
MVYFYAFKVDLQGETYEYPKQAQVTYEDAVIPARPDLIPVSITSGSSCIVVGASTTFTYKIRNNGPNIPGSFQAKITMNGSDVSGSPFTINGLGELQEKTGTFSYTFSSGGSYTFNFVVDSGNTVDEGPGEGNNAKTQDVTVLSSCGGGGPTDPPPTGGKLTGTLTIDKPEIEWGDSNLFTVTINTPPDSCKPESGKYYMSQGSIAYETDWIAVYTPTKDFYIFDYHDEYPGGIQDGTVKVSYTIKDTCGGFSLIDPKTFVIKPQPPNNNPSIDIEWFSAISNEKTNNTTQGEKVFLKVVSVSDPDESASKLTVEWDFNNPTFTPWIKSLPGKYGWTLAFNKMQYTNITAEVLGPHRVCAKVTDSRGGVGSDCADLYVTGPNPIPKINGGIAVKEGRTLTPELDANESYSPVTGRSIDHSRDEWWYEAQWDDGTTSNVSGRPTSFPKSGKVTVNLHVFDNTGLKSLSPDKHDITVVPDQPPVIQFEYSGTITRGTKFFRNASYSPDGDTIDAYQVSYGYDAGNNGTCNPTTVISNDANYFAFNPPYVGNYCFRVYAKENFGKDAVKDYTVQVINDNPDVTFTVTGTATEPMPMNVTPFKPSDLVNWTATSLDASWIMNGWSVSGEGSLVSPRRESVSPNFSPFSLPLGAENYGLSKQDIITPTGGNYPTGILLSLGNNEFVILQVINTGNKIYLASTTHNPISISCGGVTGGSCGSYEIREDLDEIIFYAITDGYSGSLRFYNIGWNVYKISALRSGSVSSIKSGSFRATYGSGPGYSNTGTMPSFSNGEKMGENPRVRFNTDYKVINKTQRTIQSYRKGETVPYKTETYTTIPAVPASSTTAYPGYLWPCNDQCVLEKFFTSSSLLDAKGNYYTWEAPGLVRWDGNTGMPSVVGNIGSGGGTLLDISADAKYVKVRVTVYEDDTYKDVEQYRNVSTEATFASKPSDFAEFLPHLTGSPLYEVFQNGFGAGKKPSDYGDLLYDKGSGAVVDKETNIIHNVWSGKEVDASIKFISDTQYASGTQLYSYVPFTGQSPYSNEAVTFGQLFNPYSAQVANGTISWSMKFHNLDHVNMHAGLGFRIKDFKNMYRLENYKDSIQLVKIVNGRKTTIGQAMRTMTNERWVTYQIKLTGNHIKVYEDGSMVIDIYDSSYTQGTIGPYSAADNTEFKGITLQWATPGANFNTPGVAIVDTNVIYDPTYSDPENDPRLDPRTQWSYNHIDTTKFLDAGDGKSGLSSLHGRTVQTVFPSFDKVGVYKIDYRVPDDPHPNHRIAYGDYLFEAHSKYAEWYSQYLIVHRRPIANFSVALGAGNKVQWTDYSYDPDRCYNSGDCQPAYSGTRGIFGEKYYYITPSGNLVQSQLTNPTESGTYIVAKAVQDEYKAWSEYYETTIYICDGCTAAPDNPPSVILTFPTGTFDAPTPVSLQPTITWNQYDPDPGTIFTTFNLTIKDQWGNCTECFNNRSMNTTQNNWAWTMDTKLSMGGKYQVQVQVCAGEKCSDWSNVGWMITNRAPSASMAYPSSTSSSYPDMTNLLRPTVGWYQSDPDPGTTFTYFRFQFDTDTDPTNGMIKDTGEIWQNTTATTNWWQVNFDLPTGIPIAVRVMTTDGYLWSDWSGYTWISVNRPPSVVLTWPTGPQTNPDVTNSTRPTVTWLQSDPDAAAVFSNYQVQILNDSFDVAADSGIVAQNTTGTLGAWTPNQDLPRSRLYGVRVQVWDQYGAASGWSSVTWFYINGPPAVDFSWTPNPAYERDTITLINRSSDPDGHSLSFTWSAAGPAGSPAVPVQTTTDATISGDITDYHPGVYVVTLTACDPYGLCSSVTKPVNVGDLTITGFVKHFDQWNLNRQAYNRAKTGDPELPRPYDMFWAGEGFKLEADVSNPAVSVNAGMSYTEMKIALSGSGGGLKWNGEMKRDDFEQLPDGNYIFTFTGVWPNGHTEADVKTIKIKGSWTEYTDIVRKY